MASDDSPIEQKHDGDGDFSAQSDCECSILHGSLRSQAGPPPPPKCDCECSILEGTLRSRIKSL